MKLILEEKTEVMNWEVFKNHFFIKYFSDMLKKWSFAREHVVEYAERFKHQRGFHTIVMDEEWPCRKFENVLIGDIKFIVTPLPIKKFPA